MISCEAHEESGVVHRFRKFAHAVILGSWTYVDPKAAVPLLYVAHNSASVAEMPRTLASQLPTSFEGRNTVKCSDITVKKTTTAMTNPARNVHAATLHGLVSAGGSEVPLRWDQQNRSPTRRTPSMNRFSADGLNHMIKGIPMSRPGLLLATVADANPSITQIMMNMNTGMRRTTG